MEEPWSDQLVLYAFLLLLLQVIAIFIPKHALRLTLVLGCFLAIWGMAFYVWNLPPPDPGEGADIGGGIMVLWAIGTVIVLGAAAVGEGIRFAARSAKRDENIDGRQRRPR